MAFANARTKPNDQDDSWKAAGFINFYMPNGNGTRTKVGALALKANDKNHAILMDYLSKDPEANIAKLMTKLIVDFKSAEKDPGNTIVLD